MTNQANPDPPTLGGIDRVSLRALQSIIADLLPGVTAIAESDNEPHLRWLWRGKLIAYETVLGRIDIMLREAALVPPASPTAIEEETDQSSQRYSRTGGTVQSEASSAQTGNAEVCNRCGGPHLFDTSVPSEAWNHVIRPHGEVPDMLCLSCIVQAFVKARTNFAATLHGSDFTGTLVVVADRKRLCDYCQQRKENVTERDLAHICEDCDNGIRDYRRKGAQ